MLQVEDIGVRARVKTCELGQMKTKSLGVIDCLLVAGLGKKDQG